MLYKWWIHYEFTIQYNQVMHSKLNLFYKATDYYFATILSLLARNTHGQQ